MLLMIMAGVVEGLGLGSLVPIATILSGNAYRKLSPELDALLNYLSFQSSFSRLAIVVIGFAIAMIARAFVILARDRKVFALQATYAEYRRQRLFNAVAGAQWNRLVALSQARVTDALTSETARVAVAIQSALRMAVATAMLLGQVGVAFVISWQVGLSAAALLVVAALFGRGRISASATYGAQVGKRSLAMANTNGQLLAGLKQNAAENRQEKFASDFALESNRVLADQISYQARSARFTFLTSSAAAVAISVALLTGAWAEVNLSALMVASIIMVRVITFASSLQREVETYWTAVPAHQSITALEAELAHHESADRIAEDIEPGGRVSFDRVTFRYGGQSAGVCGISFEIRPGEFLGLVGASGAGKTTVVDLVAGLLHPQAGTISIGEEELTEERGRAWRNRIAYVPQDGFLSNSSIRENLSVGDGASDDRIWEALNLASVADEISAMPDLLETSLFERGGRVSGGERQRIAIARALLRRPYLLILDEATNAIDVATERRILTAIKRHQPDLAAIIVSHRTETLAHCTRILTIQDGRLVEKEPNASAD